MTEAEKLELDRALFGMSVECDGVRLDPRSVRYRDGLYTVELDPTLTPAKIEP